jgi:predicted nucleic acid-binding protein
VYLVDTSVWIDFLKEKRTKAVDLFQQILASEITYGITGIIYQEILQGASTEKDFNKLESYFSTQRFFEPKDSLSTYQNAAQLYFNCRRKGITLRSSIDCLIAQIAIENKVTLLHNDKDFVNIKRIAALSIAP